MQISDKSLEELQAVLTALDKVQAVIWFRPDGTIVEANQNFCGAMGYTENEIIGQHHRIFVTSEWAASRSYRDFWDALRRGEAKEGEFTRISKRGAPVYISASYVPVRDEKGNVEKIVKFAMDRTADKNAASELEGKIDSLSRSQAVIEFDLTGKILTANDNFLSAMGYSLEEVKGKHHSIFVDPVEAASDAYTRFWEELRSGQFNTSEFRRIGKGGREVWIQASYNPILDIAGKPFKIVKYATDVTERRQATNTITERLSRLARGDLSVRLPSNFSQEFAELRDAFNQTLEQLNSLVGGIINSAESIAGESDSIASIARDLSVRCEKQAATVEETSAAMEEMSAAVVSNAESAELSTKSAEQATHHASEGGRVVQSAVEAMDRITAGSAEVRKIIEVIDSIAFQTNLLALNAGVEAARAGEAGRGFAVVASEVRALAQRTSEAARNISELIESSSKDVTNGSLLVGKSGNALKDIEKAITEVSGGILSIHSASQEQATSAQSITSAIGQIDGSTQKTAAIAEESAAAASSLAASAKDLQKLVAIFNGNRPSAGMSPAPRPSSQPASGKSSMGGVAGNTALAAATEAHQDIDSWEEF